MTSETRKNFQNIWGFRFSRGRNCVRVKFVCILFSGNKKEESNFPSIPGGFIVIAVGDGEELTELPISVMLPKPTTLTTSYNVRNLHTT